MRHERHELHERDSGPALVMESWSDSAGWVAGPAPAVDVRPPGGLLAERAAVAVRRAVRAYDRTIGTHRGCDPRHRSIVEHRLDQPARDVVDALRRDGEVRLALGAVRLQGDAAPPAYDPVDHEYRLRTRLRLAWSWPALPTWLAVGELSSTTSALRLSLRSRRRLRYPARYFDAAHRALTGLEHNLSRRASRAA